MKKTGEYFRSFAKAGLSVVALQAAVPHALAQDDGIATELILVTAQRRPQAIQDVPISLTTFSSEALDLLRATEISEYLAFTPNVSVQGRGDRFAQFFTIRGAQNFGGRANALGIYVDGFNLAPSSSIRTYNQNLIDVERIEVLRGPQGTTFGRNVIGGAINIVSKAPDDAFALGGTLDVAHVADSSFEVLARASVNAPVTDTLFARLSVAYEYEDGWIDNVGPSGNSNEFEDIGVRGALRWVPNELITADFSVTYEDAQQYRFNTIPTGVLQSGTTAQGLAPFSAFPIPNSPGGAGFFPENDDTIAYDAEALRRVENLTLTGKVELDFDSFQIISVTGYIDSQASLLDDGDGSGADVLVAGDPIDELKSFSQEVRVLSQVNDQLFVQGGALYASDEQTQQTFIRTGADTGVFGFLPSPPFPADTPLFPLPPNFTLQDDLEITETRQLAVFGEVSYSPVEDLELIFGARYTNDKVEQSLTDTGGTMSDEETFDDITLRASAVYTVTQDVNVYATFSQGFKSGGLQLGNEDAPFFGNERANNFEIGVKGSGFDGRLTTNIAAFYMDWKDIQLSVTDVDDTSPTFLQTFTQNIGQADVKGIEADVTLIPVDNLTLNLAVGFLDAEFGDTPGCNGVDTNCDGTDLPRTSRWNASWSAQYDMDLPGDWEGYGRVDGFYRSSQRDFLGALPVSDELFIPAYQQWNLRAGVRKNNLSVAVFAENIGDRRAINGLRNPGGIALGGISAVLIEPRTIGLRISYSTP